MKRIKFLVVSILCAHTPCFAKGLESMQASPSESEKPAAPAPTAAKPEPNSDGKDKAETKEGTVTNPPPTVYSGPLSERLTMATGPIWVNLSGNKGGWHSSSAADLEFAYRATMIMEKFEVLASFRYRPVEVLVRHEAREYRGIVEAYLFGAKLQTTVMPKLQAFASGELGPTTTHLKPTDSLPQVEESLEKSGVDLSLGAGVSYRVLDKLGVGTKIAVGAGAFKTLQIGLDIRLSL